MTKWECMKQVEKDMKELQNTCPILRVSFYYLFDLSFKHILAAMDLSRFLTPGDFVQTLTQTQPSGWKAPAGKAAGATRLL